MADTIHYSLSLFRDTILNAVSRLEFELRDAGLKNGSTPQQSNVRLEEIIRDLSKRIETLESRKEIDLTNELLNMKATNNTKNVIVSPNIRSTPALTAAVAAASIALPEFELNHDNSDSDSCCSSDGDVIETISAIEKDESFEKNHNIEEVGVEEQEAEVEEEEEVEEEDVVEETTEEEEHHEVIEEETEEEVEEEQEELKEIKIKGVKYFIDSNNTVYSETEDGYEEVGTFNPKTKTIEAIVVEEEEKQEDEEDDEEEAIEVEDFIYKGTTYQKDQEGNVYLDGEQIGTWNGKKIIKNA
jgi:hypothetical protein